MNTENTLVALAVALVLVLLVIAGVKINQSMEHERACEAHNGHMESRNCHVAVIPQTVCYNQSCRTNMIITNVCDDLCISTNGEVINIP